MYSTELILTLAVLLGAVLWAARELYRWTRRASSRIEGAGRVCGCEAQHDGCGHCPVVTPVSDSGEDCQGPSDRPPK